ncbi:MAG: ABC transporter ATP-binding protein [Stellaceae bacterium]
MDQEPPLLSVEDLRVYFYTRAGTGKAVDGVDLSLGRRETLGLVGESGSGKTITSLAMLRLVPPPARIVGGRILFEGDDLLLKSKRQMQGLRGKRIAMVFQNPAFSLNPLLSIGAQLAEIVRWHEKLGPKAAEARVVDMFRQVGIAEAGTRFRQFPHEMSGGMKQRVCIARALLCHPALVLADEPTTNLDVTIQAQVLDLLGELRDRFNTAMVLVTHDMGVVARMADRISVMYAGGICESADARTIFHAPQHPYTRALLESIPRADQRYSGAARIELPTIGGRPPDIMSPPSGCPFHPRCPEASEECSRFKPALANCGPGHMVSCLKRGSPVVASAISELAQP